MIPRASAFAALLLASCAQQLPLPPPPPPVALPAATEAMPLPEADMAYIARTGMAYTPQQTRLNLLVLFAERAKRARLQGFSMVWADKDRFYVNMKPPYDRVELLNLAAPELRPVLQIRAVRFDAAEIPAAQERIGAALKPIGSGWGISYDYRSDRFEVMVPEGQVGVALSLIPLDLSDYVDVIVGETVLVKGQTDSPTLIGQT